MSSDNARVNTPRLPPHLPTSPALPPQPDAVTHYENFPVASWLCPPALRAPIAALYAFARAADDLADEGDASPQQRLDDLSAYRAELHHADAGGTPQARWARIFAPLQHTVAQHALPLGLLDDLLDAFVQDIVYTRDARTYPDRAALLDYCRRSANPVGRLLLHLYGVHDAAALARSDAICSALQLANFWQDLSEDLPRGRHYLTDADCAHHGVTRADLARGTLTPAIAALVAEQLDWTRATMLAGQDLVHQLPGRIGWELRLVVQGGLLIVDKVQAQRGHNLNVRRTVHKTDAPRLLWRALRMRPPR